MLGNIFGGNQSKLKPFKRTYNNTDWGLTADVVCGAGQWTVIGEVTVPAQQEVTFGSNDPTGGAGIAGSPVYVRIDDTSAQLSGKIRFALTNANETNTIVVLEETTERLSASINDRTLAVLMPEFPTRAKEDSKLQILFYTASAKTIDFDDADTVLQVPVTVYQ